MFVQGINNYNFLLIEYESSDESIATVNDSGVVTGVSEGTVTITGTDKITGKTATHKIIVK